MHEVGCTILTQIGIEEDEENKPIAYRPYKVSLAERKARIEIIVECRSSGIVTDIKSQHVCPLHLVAQNEEESKIVVDFRSLNWLYYPLPNIPNMNEQL